MTDECQACIVKVLTDSNSKIVLVLLSLLILGYNYLKYNRELLSSFKFIVFTLIL